MSSDEELSLIRQAWIPQAMNGRAFGA